MYAFSDGNCRQPTAHTSVNLSINCILYNPRSVCFSFFHLVASCCCFSYTVLGCSRQKSSENKISFIMRTESASSLARINNCFQHSQPAFNRAHFKKQFFRSKSSWNICYLCPSPLWFFALSIANKLGSTLQAKLSPPLGSQFPPCIANV